MIPLSFVARLISAVASRKRTKTSSTSMWEFGQSQTGVHLSSSENNSGYLHIRWTGYRTKEVRKGGKLVHELTYLDE